MDNQATRRQKRLLFITAQMKTIYPYLYCLAGSFVAEIAASEGKIKREPSEWLQSAANIIGGFFAAISWTPLLINTIMASELARKFSLQKDDLISGTGFLMGVTGMVICKLLIRVILPYLWQFAKSKMPVEEASVTLPIPEAQPSEQPTDTVQEAANGTSDAL
jgi:hypothetical protein